VVSLRCSHFPDRDSRGSPWPGPAWAGIGLAAGLTNPTEGLGAVGCYAALKNYTALGGQLMVFALP